jgi:hypothetical protein
MALLASVLVLPAAAQTDDTAPPTLPEGTQRLMNDYPDVRPYFIDGRVAALYGAPMVAADTPADAVNAFLMQYGDAFGVNGLGVQLAWSNEIGDTAATDAEYGPHSNRAFTVYAYHQVMDGLPVESSLLRILVRNGLSDDADTHLYRVVYAAGRLAPAPPAPLAPDAATEEDALYAAMNHEDALDLTEWSSPELVIYSGDEQGRDIGATPVRAWKLFGEGSAGDEPARRCFFVEAATRRRAARSRGGSPCTGGYRNSDRLGDAARHLPTVATDPLRTAGSGRQPPDTAAVVADSGQGDRRRDRVHRQQREFFHSARRHRSGERAGATCRRALGQGR